MQLWSERFDTELEDLFVVQERLASRVAEALRVSLYSVGHEQPLPHEALELYVRAKQQLRSPNLADSTGAREMLAKVIELAPSFAPAYAAHALACIREWFQPEGQGTNGSWTQQVEASIARAKEHAPELAETFLASATYSSQSGDYRAAAGCLRRALDIAPTLPEAHQLLGVLSIEAGRAKEGLARLDLALSLEPTLSLAIFEQARWQGLYGDLATAEALMRRMRERGGVDLFTSQLDVRIGAYRGDLARTRRGVEALERVGTFNAIGMASFGKVFLGGVSDLASMEHLVDAAARPGTSPRFASLVHQLAAETYGHFGQNEGALRHIQAAAEGALVDLEWLDRCPLLHCVREEPAFVEARRIVRARCADIWRA